MIACLNSHSPAHERGGGQGAGVSKFMTFFLTKAQEQRRNYTKMTRKRFWALVLALCMTLSLMSPGVLASEASPTDSAAPLPAEEAVIGEAPEESAEAVPLPAEDTDTAEAPEESVEAVLSPAIEAVSETVEEAELQAVVANGEFGDGLTWILDDSGLLTVTGSGAMPDYGADTDMPWYSRRTMITDITIGRGITRIGNRAFVGCTGLERVTIPETVESIGEYAFSRCTALAAISIPGNVLTVGSYAFSGCTGLTDITTGDGVTTIGSYAFQGCSDLHKITLADTVATIGERAFVGCTALEEVNLSSGLNSIGQYAFYNCASLAKIAIPNGTTVIGAHAFENCTAIESITIPGSVTNLNEYAFYNCTSLKNLTLSNGLATIGRAAFETCTSLQSVTIPGSVATIDFTAFYKCANLKNVTIRNGVTKIEKQAFRDCTRLQNITIPNSVTTIKNGAFLNCGRLREVYYTGSDGQWNGVTVENYTERIDNNANDSYWSDGNYRSYYSYLTNTNSDIQSPNANLLNANFHYRASADSTLVTETPNIEWKFENGTLTISGTGDMTEYGSAEATPWYSNRTGILSIVVEDGVTGIADYAFAACTGVQSVSIAASVTSIGSNAFAGCTSLTDVKIENGMSIIWGSAFSGCTGLETIDFPESVVYMGGSVFKGCTNLAQVTLPVGLTFVPAYMFQGCNSLTEISFPDQVAYIGSYAFDGCTSLRDVQFSGSIARVDSYAFQNCTALKTLVIPSTLSTIGDHAFYKCTALVNLTLQSGITAIEERAFHDCDSLRYVILPGTVTALGVYAFLSCDNLMTVTIQNGMTSIGEGAFCDCLNLQSVTIPHSVTNIASAAFWSCSNLKDVYYTGSEGQWNGVTVVQNPNRNWIYINGWQNNEQYPNASLTNATFHYDYVPQPPSVTLEKSTLTLWEAEYETLLAEVTPVGMGLNWTSSNSDVADVSSAGTVAAKTPGTAVITATTADGTASASCTVTVNATIRVTGVTLDKTSVTVTEGETVSITATVAPADATNPRLVWSSSNASIAECNNGIVIGKKAGTANITVSSADGGKTATCSVTVKAATVEIPVESVTLDKVSMSLSDGATGTLLVSVLPATASNRTVTWVSANPDVADVSNGIVTAKSVGSTEITVSTTDGGKSAYCVVTVTPAVISVTGVRLDETEIKLNTGTFRKLVATVQPENADNQTVEWESYNTSVAVVSSDGTVTAMNPGTTVITATTQDGRFAAACALTVTSPEITKIEITPPTNTKIPEGSPLDVTGLSVRAVYENQSTADVTDYTLSGYQTTPGVHTVNVNFTLDGKQYTASFDVTVEAKLAGITVKSPDKTSYAKGEELDLTGMVVTATYSDQREETLSAEDYTVTGYNASLTGAQILTVSYKGTSAQFSVAVSEASEPAETAILPPRMRITGYPGGKEVALSHEDTATKIFYTTNGDAPTASSDSYDGTPLRMTERTVVKAIAIKDGKSSSVASGLITVPKTATPTISHASGTTLLPGTIVTLKCSDSNATFYYTADGSEPSLESTRYGGSILVDRPVTIRAIAVKDGYQVSDSVEATYFVQETEPQRHSATIAVGHVESRAGEHVSNSVSIFTEENTKITGFRFTIQYDKRALEYVSLSPVEGEASSHLFASEDRENGKVTVLCSDVSMQGGEVCVLNFNALDSDEDGVYDLSVVRENIAIVTDDAAPLAISFESGSVTLTGSHNSQLTGQILYTGENGNSLSSVDNLAGHEITANIVIDPPDQKNAADMLVTANVFLCVYDENGLMCSLNTWEIDLSDIQHLMFMQTVRVPDNIRVSEIKTMILSDELTPLIAASEL